MSKTLCAALFCAIGIPIAAFSAWEAGLNGGFVSHREVRIDKTRWPSPADTAAYSGPVAANTNQTWGKWANDRTWVYWGQMYFNGGEYYFMKHFDDAWMLKIDGQVIMEDAVDDGKAWDRVEITDAVTLPKGWHDIELRFGNLSGGVGPRSEEHPGFGVFNGSKPNDLSEYVYPEDPGDMTVFRHDDGRGLDEALSVSSSLGEYNEFGAPHPPYGEHGSPNPPYGMRLGLTEGATVACRMSGMTDRTVTVDGIDYRLEGYSLYEFDPNTRARKPEPRENGTGDSLTYTHGASQGVLVWNWKLNGFHLDATSDDAMHGSVALDPQGGVYASNTVVMVTAVPEKGFRFVKWIGEDIPDSDRGKTTLSITITKPVTIQACFLPEGDNCYYVSPSGNDDTNNGLSWETAFATPETALGRIHGDGGRIVLDAGRYVVNSTLVIENAIVLEGAPGRGEVIITREKDDPAVANLLKLNHRKAVVRGLVFDGNREKLENAGKLSFAVKIENGIVEKCVIRNTRNNGDGEGGGVNMTGGTLRDCIIENNCRQAKGGWGGGGGLYMYGICVAERCLIRGNAVHSNNEAEGGGAFLAVVRGDRTGWQKPVLRNSLITGNKALNQGSGVFMGNGILHNCTVAGNRCGREGNKRCAGLYVNGTWPAVVNCIVDRNDSGEAQVDIGTNVKKAIISYSCSSTPLPADMENSGNIQADPGFMSPGNGDFHLSMSSPCYNAGTTLDWMTEDATDLDGNRRIFKEIPDIGCYENVGSTAMFLLVR